MALTKYGAAEASLVINGIPIEEFGDTDPPITLDDAEERTVQKDGIGGTGLRLDRVNQPKTLVVNLMPGSDEVRQLLAVQATGADFTCTFRQIGTNEVTVMWDGTMNRRGPQGRAGRGSVTDEQFTFRFRDSQEG